MSQSTLLAAAAMMAGLFAVACDGSSDALLEPPGIVAAASPAFTETTQEFVPVTINMFIPCALDGAGELVIIEGTLHNFTHTTIKGDHLTWKQHSNPRHLFGYGQTSGDRYVSGGVTQQTETVKGVSYPYTYTWVGNFNYIGPGPGNNWRLHAEYHITINANGDVTTEVDNWRMTCK